MNIKKILSIMLLIILLSAASFADTSDLNSYYDYDLELYGLKDADENIILKPTYDYISGFWSGYSIVEKDSLMGAIDMTGKLIIPTDYQELSYLKNSNALAVKDDKIGMISKYNKTIFDFEWDGVDMIEYPSNYNTFVFQKGNLYGVANFDGEILLSDIEAKLSHISDNSVAFSTSDYVGVMDFKGNIIVKEEYDSVYAIKNGYIAQKADKYEFLDESGNIRNSVDYDNVELLSDDLYIVSKYNDNDEELYGLYNASTDENVLSLIYDYIGIKTNYFDNDKKYLSLSIYDQSNIYNSYDGIADLDGNIILDAKYTNIRFLSKDIIAYSDSDYKSGFYSLRSKKSTDIKFDTYKVDNDLAYLIVKDYDDKYGLMNMDLSYEIPLKSDYIYKSANTYISKKDDMFALYNPLTKKMGNYKYDSIYGFKSIGELSLSVVEYNGKFAMINESERFIVAPTYDNISTFNDGYAVVSKDDKFGFIGENGKIFVETKYDMLYNFTNGFAIYELDGKYGYLNKSANEVISAKFDSASTFDENGYAAVSLNDKVGVIDRSGRYTVEAIYSDIYKLKDNLLVVEDAKTSLLGIADVEGNVIIDTNCSEIGYFNHDDATYIKVNSQYALINSKAEIITTFDFDYIGEFSGSFAEIEIDGKKGIINARGEYITE